jgi:transposase
LYSSRPVDTVEEAFTVIKYYKARWMIEDLFRALKTEGVNYQETELETGATLRKLFVIAFMRRLYYCNYVNHVTERLIKTPRLFFRKIK